MTTRTGPPAGSTRASQPAPRCTGRSGISRAGRDRASSRPSCRTSSRAPPAELGAAQHEPAERGGGGGSRWRSARSTAAAAPRGPAPGRAGRAPPARAPSRLRAAAPGALPRCAGRRAGRTARRCPRSRPRAPGCRPRTRPAADVASVGVDRRAAGAGVHGQPGQPGQLVVGNPVAGEDQRARTARTAAAPVRTSATSTALQPSRARRSAVTGARGPHRHPPAHRRAEPERGVALLPLVLGDQRDHVGAGVRERQRGRERHVLGPDHQRPPGQPLPAQVDPLLQLAGGHHPGRAVAGDQPRRPRPLPAPGGEQHRRRRAPSRGPPALVSVTACEPSGPGVQPVTVVPGPQLRARRLPPPTPGPARRPGRSDPVQVAQPVAGVPAVPGHAAGRRLPVGHQHRRRRRGGAARRRPTARPGPAPTTTTPALTAPPAPVRSPAPGHRPPRAARHRGRRSRSPGSARSPRGSGGAARRGRRAARAGQRVPDLAAGDPLAVADDLAVRRVGRDPRPRPGTAARPASPMYGITRRRRRAGPGRGFSGSPASSSRPATCSAMPSDADRPVERIPADARVPPPGVDPDLVVGVLGGGPQPRVRRGDLLVRQPGQDPPPGGRAATGSPAARGGHVARGRARPRAVGPSSTLP